MPSDIGAIALIPTLLFLALYVFTDLGQANPYDTYIFLVLLALDSNTLLRYWLWRQSGR